MNRSICSPKDPNIVMKRSRGARYRGNSWLFNVVPDQSTCPPALTTQVRRRPLNPPRYAVRGIERFTDEDSTRRVPVSGSSHEIEARRIQGAFPVAIASGKDAFDFGAMLTIFRSISAEGWSRYTFRS